MGAKNRSRNIRKSDKAISKGVKPKTSGTDGKWSSQHHLPIEILEKIIRHLDVPSLKSASLVCEYWRMVIGNNSKYLLFHGKTHTEKETFKARISDILFVGNGVVITQLLHPKKDLEYDNIITVFDNENDKMINDARMTIVISFELFDLKRSASVSQKSHVETRSFPLDTCFMFQFHVRIISLHIFIHLREDKG